MGAIRPPLTVYANEMAEDWGCLARKTSHVTRAQPLGREEELETEATTWVLIQSIPSWQHYLYCHTPMCEKLKQR